VNGSLLIEIFIPGGALLIAYMAFRQSSRAEVHKAMAVDAGAYSRAKDIYEGVIKTLAETNESLQSEIGSLHTEIGKLRGEIVQLRHSNAALSAEVAELRTRSG
jgi:predicted  nucleic acid-binding Zn-ribbon protein